MNVSSNKCQLSIKSEERKVFSPKVVDGTPSRTENKGNINAAAKWTVVHQCLSFCKATPSASLLKLGTCWKGLLKSLVHVPVTEERQLRQSQTKKLGAGRNRSLGPILTNLSIDAHTSLWIVTISLSLKQMSANFSVKGQTVNTSGVHAKGSLWQLLNTVIAIAQKQP